MNDTASVVAGTLFVLGMIVILVGVLVIPKLRHRAAHPPPGAPADPEPVIDTPDAVMRALTLVQQRYAALVREHDQLLSRNRDLQEENDRLRARANR